MGNLSACKNRDEWLEKRPDFMFRYTPTSASYLNPIELGFLALTRKVVRGGSFVGQEDLKRKIRDFFEVYNEYAESFVYMPNEIQCSQLENTLKNLCN
jgi:hypothetical protein